MRATKPEKVQRRMRDQALKVFVGMIQDQAAWSQLLADELELAKRRVALLRRQLARGKESAALAKRFDVLAQLAQEES